MLKSDGVILEYKNALGETLTYKTVMTTVQEKKEADADPEVTQNQMEIIMDQTVVKLQGTTADINMHIVGGFIERNGKIEDLPFAGQVIETTMESSGKLTKTSINTGINQPVFPKGLTRIGFSWQENRSMLIPINNQEKNINLCYNYTLSELTHERNYEVAVIDINVPEVSVDIGDNIKYSIGIQGRTLFAHRAGRMVSSHVCTDTRVNIPSAQLSLNTKVNIDTHLQHVDSPVPETPEVEEHFIIGF
ncbi:hypothetical protein IJT93_01800 [bacterium]|nr:hypothetical protein [bacterium]